MVNLSFFFIWKFSDGPNALALCKADDILSWAGECVRGPSPDNLISNNCKLQKQTWMVSQNNGLWKVFSAWICTDWDCGWSRTKQTHPYPDQSYVQLYEQDWIDNDHCKGKRPENTVMNIGWWFRMTTPQHFNKNTRSVHSKSKGLLIDVSWRDCDGSGTPDQGRRCTVCVVCWHGSPTPQPAFLAFSASDTPRQ